MPFAGLINKPEHKSVSEFTSENFTYCSQNILKEITSFIVAPINALLSSLTALVSEFTKFWEGHHKKNTFYIPKSCEKILISYMEKNFAKSLWLNLTLRNPRRNLMEKLKFFQRLPKILNFEKLYLAHNRYGVIQIPSKGENKWTFYPIAKSIPSAPIVSKVSWENWKQTKEGKVFLKNIANNKKQDQSTPLTAIEAALMNVNLWFIHSNFLKKKKHFGEYFSL